MFFLIFLCASVHQKQFAYVSFQNKKALVFCVTTIYSPKDLVAILRFTGDLYIDIPGPAVVSDYTEHRSGVATFDQY